MLLWTGLLYPMLEIEVCFPYYLRILSFLINILQILFYSRIYDYGYCCTSPFYYSLFMISSPAHFFPFQLINVSILSSLAFCFYVFSRVGGCFGGVWVVVVDISGSLLNSFAFCFMAKYLVVYLAFIDSGSYSQLEFNGNLALHASDGYLTIYLFTCFCSFHFFFCFFF